MRVLIVKTSSLGDIVQAFPTLNYLHDRFPHIAVDWVVEESLAPLAEAHPLICKVISLDMKGLKNNWFRPKAWRGLFRSIRELRKEKYDLIFDLQGNCKSGVITLCSRGVTKVGFSWKSVREWPNIFATKIRFETPKQINIRLQHLRLLQSFFKDEEIREIAGVRFKIDSVEREKIRSLLSCPPLISSCKIMVCPGSKWANKQVPLETMIALLQKMEESLHASFLLVWGSPEEKSYCEEIQKRLARRSCLTDLLPLPTWQNLIDEMDLVIAVDSSALHLCGTTSTPSFSIFGPTNADIFKPIGHRHFAYQGSCPYGRIFDKTCPILRSCPTGACIRSLPAEEIYAAFIHWWKRQCD